MTIRPKLRFDWLDIGFDKGFNFGMHGLTMFGGGKH